MSDRTIIRCEDPDDLARRAADWMAARLGSPATARYSVCLSGGSTPKRLYERLTQEPWRRAMAWDRIHWFWGDERVVPHDDPRSNYRMAADALLSRAPVAASHVHPVPTDRETPEACAEAYEGALRAFHGTGDEPLFDVTLLGLGSDGHTASLFPGSPAVDETERWCRASQAGLEPFVPRVTLTIPAFARSRAVVFLVAGADKAAVLRRVLDGEPLPSGRVLSAMPTVWFVDRAALGEG